MGKEDKSIVRVVKNKDNPYVMLNKSLLDDDRLSWKAKGILAYLLSKPDDWTIIIEHLIKQSTDGEKSLRAGLNELKEFNYLQRYPVYKNGLVIRWESTVYEQPYSDNEKIKSAKENDNGSMEYQLLAQNGKVGQITENTLLSQNLQVGNVDVEKEGLLITDGLPITDGTDKSDLMEFDTIGDLEAHYSKKYGLPYDRVMTVYDRVKDQWKAGNIKSFKNYFEKALEKEKQDYNLNQFIE